MTMISWRCEYYIFRRVNPNIIFTRVSPSVSLVFAHVSKLGRPAFRALLTNGKCREDWYSNHKPGDDDDERIHR